MGLSLGLTLALGSGLFGGPAAAEFVRTPKTGGQRLPATASGYRPPRDRLADLEVLLGVGYLLLAGLALLRRDLTTAIGLGLGVASGLLWVGLSSARRSSRL
jgi:hypothetical protein